ncbi:hypothetical protein BO71DRAFT_411772 [Aspergillus ellipticus CBS 707.79]|uniref:Secreted protein n=1 Tax=Aspergillus ellipticus CBS 707.79 TaxID=1448320 RepID=A0A319D1X6_9EURO|nr:hypothetical protein BO71DRAFT_411772 [Aspergillus ellipticus CBS 707.79]
MIQFKHLFILLALFGLLVQTGLADPVAVATGIANVDNTVDNAAAVAPITDNHDDSVDDNNTNDVDDNTDLNDTGVSDATSDTEFELQKLIHQCSGGGLMELASIDQATDSL